MSTNKQETNVSAAVIRRLPRYFRYLRMLMSENVLRICSNDLAERMNVTASQIRQDLNCFGGFGQQGYGYNVTYLYGKISEILGVNDNFQAIIIGAGKLGSALAGSPVFSKRGVEVCALFDVNKDAIGKKVADIPVYDIEALTDFCSKNTVDIAVLTLPASEAHKAAETLTHCGVKGIWNYTSTELFDSDFGITVQNVHMGDSLMMLCYEIKCENEGI